MAHLLIVHIGPVQEFIAAARRSRDLWFGSWLLSELSKSVAAVLARELENGGQLLFPAPRSHQYLEPDSDFNVANKIVAILPAVPQGIDAMLRDAVQQRLRTLWGNTKIRGALDSPERAWVQIADLPELFWVSVPVDLKSEKGYARARRKAEALMAARKTARTFDEIPWDRGSGQPKSSLDGSRESVIPESAYPNRSDSAAEREQKIRTLYSDYGARAAERLSGVDLLKRHGSRQQQHNFPSTSHVAAQPLLARFGSLPADRQNTIRMGWLAYISSLPDEAQESTSTRHPVLEHCDGSMLFEARLRENLEQAEFEEAREQLRTFLRVHLDGRKPLPYYAILLADGDRMGEVINHQATDEAHRTLSGRLSGFAGNARRIVRDHDGEMIFSGGDDVLALLPLHRALACVKELSSVFEAQMKGFTNKRGQSPTLSAGLAVSHHIEPMSDALALARQAEKAAKSVEGKNALAVTVSKRSGADMTVMGKWGSVDDRLTLFIALHRREVIPDGAAFDLRGLVQRLSVRADTEENRRLSGTLNTAIIPEAMRILARKRGGRGTQAIPDAVLRWLCQCLGDVEREEGNLSDRWRDESSNEFDIPESHLIGGSTASPIERVARLADEMIVARLFADAEEQAAPSKQREEVPA